MAKKKTKASSKKYSSTVIFVDNKNINFYSWLLFFVLSMTAGFIYSQTFQYPFQLDDLSSIVEDRTIRDVSNFLGMSFKGDFPFVEIAFPTGTRDFGKLSFALNYYFGGLNPWGYHFVNVLIHIATSITLFLSVLTLFETPLLKRTNQDITKKYILAMACALIFLAHPLQTQAVTYMVQRYASLCTLLYGLSFLFYMKSRVLVSISDETGGFGKFSRGSIAYLVLSFISIYFAMKTKEIAFTIPFVIIIADFVFFGLKPKELMSSLTKERLISIAVLVVTIPIIPITIILPQITGGGEGVTVLASVAAGFSEATQETDVFTRGQYFATQMIVILHYLRLFFIPVGQNFDYEFTTYETVFSIIPFLGFLFHASMYLSAFYFIVRGWKKENVYSVLYGFGVIWFYMTISVESSIVPIRDVVFEHRMYLPLFGLVISVMSLIMWVLESKRQRDFLNIFLSFAVVWFIVLSIFSYNRNFVWANQLSLWEDVVKKSPNKARPHNNLGAYYEISGQRDKALKEYMRAIELKPDYAHAYNNVGAVYAYYEDYDKALKNYKKAIEITPTYGSAYYNIGTAYLKIYRLKDAEEALLKAARLKKYHHKSRYNLGIAYERMGRMREAKNWYLKAVDINPDYNHALYRLGIIYLNEGDRDAALKTFTHLLEIDPNNKDALNAYNALKNNTPIEVVSGN